MRCRIAGAAMVAGLSLSVMLFAAPALAKDACTDADGVAGVAQPVVAETGQPAATAQPELGATTQREQSPKSTPTVNSEAATQKVHPTTSTTDVGQEEEGGTVPAVVGEEAAIPGADTKTVLKAETTPKAEVAPGTDATPTPMPDGVRAAGVTGEETTAQAKETQRAVDDAGSEKLATQAGSGSAQTTDGWVRGADGVWRLYRQGRVQTGWQAHEGNWYYFDAKGDPLKGQQRVYADNKETHSAEDKRHYYYFDDATGIATKGWKYIKSQDKWVYYDLNTSQMQYNQQNVRFNVNNSNWSSQAKDGDYHWYLFDQHTGAALNKWNYIGSQDKWVYYDDVMRWMLYGEHFLHDNNQGTGSRYWYYFDDHTGATTYGYKRIERQGKTVYYARGSGKMAHEWANADGKMIYFDKYTGKKITESQAAYSAWLRIRNNRSATNFYATIDNSNYRAVFFTRVDGQWAPVKDFLCAVGNPRLGSTFRGYSRILSKGRVMGWDPYEYFWTEFFNNGADPTGEGQRFHSILYTGRRDPDNPGPVYEDGRGAKSSHGCVRVALHEARWIYDNVPIGSAVHSFD